MKKRILVIAICLILTISAFCLPAYATPSDTDLRNVSEDYKTVFYNGNTYVRIDDHHFVDFSSTSVRINMPLSETQQEEIESIVASSRGAFIELDITYKKGGYVCYYYINQDRLDDYNEFLTRGGDVYEAFDPYWGIDFAVSSTEFLDYPIQVKGYEVKYYSVLIGVSNYDSGKSFKKYSGDIITDGHNNFYYLDYYQFGADAAKTFDAADYDTVTLYKITNPEILEQLIQDDSFIEIDDTAVATVFAVITGIILALLLGVLPLAALITALILSRKAKQPYKRLLRALALVLAVEIIVFVLAAIVFIGLIIL